MIRFMVDTDSEKVLQIFQSGIDTGNATFETQCPSWDTWNRNHLPHSRFVSEEQGVIRGWVALSPVSARRAYRGVAEVSIYVDAGYRGKGLGSELMKAVVQSSEENGIWTLYSSIFPENEATLHLHLSHGFRLIGTREKIAQLHGQWRDTLILERRSRVAGV